MKTLFRKLRTKRMAVDEAGSISIEFVLILPLLLWWYAGSFAFFDAFRDTNSQGKAAYTIGDILSRQNEIDNGYIDGLESLFKYMTASDQGVWLRVSSVKFTQDIGYTVEWSYATDGNTALTTDMVYAYKWEEHYLPIIGSGETVILSESYVPFVPAFNIGLTARTMSNAVVTRPRFSPQLINTSF
ncbi:MAG: hypothetical protein QNL54_09270 [Rhodobacterales bacterium]|jgi:Flp pilus assembly protein TadG|nr:hypothetical protein [Pseudomonadota bacterium]